MSKILSYVSIAMMPTALFAASAKGKQNDLEDAGSSAAQAVTDTAVDFLTPLLSGFVVAVILCAVVAIIVWFFLGKKISDHFKIVTELKKQLIPQNNTLVKQQITLIQSQIRELITGQKNYSQIINSLSKSLSYEELAFVLNNCSEKTADIDDKLTALLNITPKLKELNDQMQKLIEEKPDLVNISVNNTVELLKQCHSEGISSAEQISKMHEIAEHYKIAQFASYLQMYESKKYYDMRDLHKKIQKENNDLIQNIQSQLTGFQQKQQTLENECTRLKAENKALLLKKGELEQARSEKNQLLQKLQSLCPENIIPLAPLSSLLQDSAPALKSETLTLITQLYWFAQLSRNTPAKIKAAFIKVDETLYELFTEEQELLQSIRQSIQNFVNEEIFKNTFYKIEWPTLNSPVSEHEDHYFRENDEGNRICKVCNAVIMNSGKIETRAKVSTTL